MLGQLGSFETAFCNHAQGTNNPEATSLCSPQSVAVDGAGNVYVADGTNDRIVQYDTPLTTDTVGDRVFGLPSLTTGGGSCDPTPVPPTELCNVIDVAVDQAGNLYALDNGYNRILQYDSPLTTDNLPDRVFGQGDDFTTSACNKGGISAASLCGPWAIAVDAAGNLYVAEEDNARVLVYNSPLTTDTVADFVFGQGGDFSSNVCNNGGISASSLCHPRGVAADPSGNVYISDQHRILQFDSPLTTDDVADRVLAEGGSFVTNECDFTGASADDVCWSGKLALDGDGNLFVANGYYNRVLEFDNPLTNDGVADRVFGQRGRFHARICNDFRASADTLCRPPGVAVDADGNVYVADQNSRVLIYDRPLFCASPTDCDSDGVEDSSDNCPRNVNPLQEDNEAAPGWAWLPDGSGSQPTPGGDVCDADDDNDAALDVRETNTTVPSPSFCIERDPLSPWDVYDVPTPALLPSSPGGTRNGAISLVDVGAVLAYVGTVDDGGPNLNGADYDSDLNGNGLEDGVEYDRLASATLPEEPWRSREPNGAVSLIDVGIVLVQVGTNCVASWP